MARTKKRTKKQAKKKGFNIDVAVIIMVVASILLAVLIYGESGYIGETLSPILGGIFGFAKYIIPIGTFGIGIYMAYDDKNYLISKLMQYGIVILCICVVMSVYQISMGSINQDAGLDDMVSQAYHLGTRNVGGGLIGTAIAFFSIKFIGMLGTVIFALGVTVILVVIMFGFKPSEFITDFLYDMEEKKNIRREERIQERKNRISRQDMQEQNQNGKNGKIYNIDEDTIPQRKETKKERRLREEEERRRQASNVEQLTINNLGEDEEKTIGIFKKFNHDKDDIVPIGMEKKPKQSPEFIEENLFRQEQEKKEEKVKEVLQLEHTLTVEDENYEFPPITLLSEGEKKGIKGGKKAVTDTASKLQKTLYSFGVSAKVENVSVGPAITRYELKPAEGVRVSKIANLADDIALNLAAETIRIEAPIPGKQAVGIEVPNKENEVVHLRDIIDTDEFKNHKSKLAFALGKDVAGKEVVTDIAKMPHVLIAGSTGSGKSVCINTLISSIIYKAKPSDVKLVMVDPKVVELSVYNGIPHLLIPVVTDPKKAAGALNWAVNEMVNRYSLFANKNVRDIKGYNEAITKEGGAEKLPQIVIIIDELADLMMVSPKDVEDSICRLAQMARAAGMHLVIATQRPSVDVITGIIKANIPSRISFAVSSQVDSRTILDMVGAEKLLGKGDMLFYPAGAPKPVRVQGAFVSDKEVEKIVGFVKANGEATYNDDILEKIESSNNTDKDMDEQGQDDNKDPLLDEAIETVVETGQASTSFIQRRFKVGYARAGRIIDQMEERGIISGYQGSKPREVLMSKERWEELKMQTSD